MKNRLKVLFYFTLFCIFLWHVGFIYFFFTLPPHDNSHRDVDAVVIFTGGDNRIKQGFKLYKLSRAKKILISGVGKGVTKDNFKSLLREYNIEPQNLILGKLATNTEGNAMETEIFMRLNEFESMYLVTSSYHIYRSMLFLDEAMPDISVYPYPIYSKEFHSNYRFSSIVAILKAYVEYNKLVATYIDHSLNQWGLKFDRMLARFIV